MKVESWGSWHLSAGLEVRRVVPQGRSGTTGLSVQTFGLSSAGLPAAVLAGQSGTAAAGALGFEVPVD